MGGSCICGYLARYIASYSYYSVCVHVPTSKSLILPYVEYTCIYILFLSQNGLECNLRSAKFQNFPGGACPQTPLA